MKIKSILAGATIALAASLTSIGAEEPAQQLGQDDVQFAVLNGITAAPESAGNGMGLMPLTALLPYPHVFPVGEQEKSGIVTINSFSG